MNSKERIVAALNGQEADHLPFSPFLAYVWQHFPKEIQDAGELTFHHEIGADPLWRGAPCPVVGIPPEGLEMKTIEEGDRTSYHITTPVGSLNMAAAKSELGNTSFLIEHPLKTEEDYKIQTWIEENTSFKSNPQSVADHFAGNGREGLSLGMLIPRGKSAFQHLVEHQAGTEELIYALVDFPDTVRNLWQVMVQKNLEAVKIALESKYEYFITWEDSSTQNYSPDQYDEFIRSEIGEWCKILKNADRRYIQHACGHVEALVERMKNHGVFAVESLSPPPTGNLTVQNARKIIGSGMGIIGGIEPTQFLNLSGKQLSDYVEETIAAAQGGPFVLANSDSCPPGVTIEKFKQVADLVKNI